MSSTIAGKPVSVGDRAPDFTLPDAGGQAVTLSDLIKSAAVVLYFYPRDETAGCTAEACSFRDSYAAFKDAGAVVVGVSDDSPASHARFTEHHRLPFLLLSDTSGALRKAYGVPSYFGLLRGRVTYVIDRSGIVRQVFRSQLQATRHVSEALSILKQLPAVGEEG